MATLLSVDIATVFPNISHHLQHSGVPGYHLWSDGVDPVGWPPEASISTLDW